MLNDTFLRALLREPTSHTPVWIMRQAGRYLPEYNATRKKAGSFLALAKTPEYACEVTLQPLERFALDAAILFSDILTVPDAMGLGLYFVEGEGPKFERPLRDERAIDALAVPDLDRLRYVFEPWERNPRMLEAYHRARLDPTGKRLDRQGMNAIMPNAAALLADADPAYVEDVTLILKNMAYAVVGRFAAGNLDITAILPTLERAVFRLTADNETLALAARPREARPRTS